MDKYIKKIILSNIGALNSIEDLKRAIDFVKHEKISTGTLKNRRTIIKQLWWETHEYNKKNKSDLEWEMDKFIISQSKNNIKQAIYKKEYTKLLDVCDSERDKLFIETLATTGIRVSELKNIKIKHCKTVGNTIRIAVISGKTKVLTYRAIPYSLWKRIRNTFQGKIYLFETQEWKNNEGAKPFQREYISNRIKKYGKKIGLDISAHTLRKYYTTNGINSGENIIDISQDLGHLNVGSTIQSYYTGKGVTNGL